MKHSYIDKHSDIDSIVHRLDARFKIVGAFLLVALIAFTRPDSFLLFGLYLLLMGALIALSKIPLLYVIGRSLVIFQFVVFIVIFIPFFKEGGLVIFRNVVARSYLSVLCMITLMASTKFSDLLKALEKLKIPKLFIMILSFMYRYIFVVTDELMKMAQAKEARSVGGSRWFHIRTLANMIGVLFIRAYERAEVVYTAMLSRGYENAAENR